MRYHFALVQFSNRNSLFDNAPLRVRLSDRLLIDRLLDDELAGLHSGRNHMHVRSLFGRHSCGNQLHAFSRAANELRLPCASEFERAVSEVLNIIRILD